MRFFITGGAGYIGSHVVLMLLDAGHEVVVLDNLSTGHRQAVPPEARFILGDLSNTALVDDILSDGPWDGIMHFAARSLVAESMREPFMYLRQNVEPALSLIELAVRHKVPAFVFSSTAALFSNIDNSIISENSPVAPCSPYGESKLMVERALYWADRVHGLRSACLRYFNAAGADPKGRAGEDHQPETHLIPLAIQTVLGKRPSLDLFGNDYPTPDGSCIRDYVHVTDLARAHLAAVGAIGQRSVTYNIGNGKGYSNLQVVQSIERVSGRRMNWRWAPRRAGDPAVLVASSALLQRETGWKSAFHDLDTIVETALAWAEKYPDGYASVSLKKDAASA
ncbi:UDP-glucose 4-epimerase GalE [Komagataeibacter melaceti]|uniref:UDP-glucose 4-epimerase n=1 Tax=Komagataeibacter melaceti TaxID=2766577 RepID=A0A371YYE8_9PROT|nr:UDP-glucose 4-epimerase GalE [Komagataeibacter melaceti]RFD19255.1 UDP-glucose 4-epimerase GalE [Komagataeibacter melaceti]